MLTSRKVQVSWPAFIGRAAFSVCRMGDVGGVIRRVGRVRLPKPRCRIQQLAGRQVIFAEAAIRSPVQLFGVVAVHKSP